MIHKWKKDSTFKRSGDHVARYICEDCDDLKYIWVRNIKGELEINNYTMRGCAQHSNTSCDGFFNHTGFHPRKNMKKVSDYIRNGEFRYDGLNATHIFVDEAKDINLKLF